MNNLLFLPISLNIMLDEKEIIEKFSPSRNFHVWNFEKLTESNSKYGENNFTKEAQEKYPQIVELVKLLPFSSISNVKINYQTKETKYHIDFVNPEEGNDLYKNVVTQEPSGYRVILQGSKDVILIKNKNKIQIAKLPDDSNIYVIGQTNCLHKVVEDKNRITIYITGFLDKEKHQKIIQHSLKKYKKYAIFLDN